GVGVVHPVDMHHGGNPPISAALLRLLSEGLDAEVLRLGGVIAGTMPQLQANDAEREGALRQLQEARAALEARAGERTEAVEQANNRVEDQRRRAAGFSMVR
ncbi:hypothetical protein E3A20_28510, partial [Planctomyces bekefii]